MNIFVCSHGNFAKELIKSGEMIAGKMNNVSCFCLQEDMSMEKFKSEIEKKIIKIKESSKDKKIIALVDLFGGTPCIAVTSLTEIYNLTIITGVNLAMLLELQMIPENYKNKEVIGILKDVNDNSFKIIQEGKVIN